MRSKLECYPVSHPYLSIISSALGANHFPHRQPQLPITIPYHKRTSPQYSSRCLASDLFKFISHAEYGCFCYTKKKQNISTLEDISGRENIYNFSFR
ncbi:unnamed protein product [Tuber melanosporum]|uniref:(Perigord truffle) hypothetical protein n=1 Tax=Tuber melanosporum (strain Mel28) TaxID=656061 RepID=D5G577_TUBMM|nr:uncharacterized protein GSTUM_00000344001 [Tuber melanosporum]CAZ79670.1 unnamed protein product [Tuber melanosporum]